MTKIKASKKPKRITDKEFREMFLTDPERFRKMMISEGYILTFRSVETIEPATAATVATFRGITVQAASSALRYLYEVGYLNRKRIKDPTGGYIFEYTSFRF